MSKQIIVSAFNRYQFQAYQLPRYKKYSLQMPDRSKAKANQVMMQYFQIRHIDLDYAAAVNEVRRCATLNARVRWTFDWPMKHRRLLLDMQYARPRCDQVEGLVLVSHTKGDHRRIPLLQALHLPLNLNVCTKMRQLLFDLSNIFIRRWWSIGK